MEVVIDFSRLDVEVKMSVHNFITSSMLKSLYYNSDFEELPKGKYYALFNPIINQMLEKCKVKVIVDSEDYKYFYGYMLYSEIDDKTVKCYYIYIKFPYRNQGLAKRLVDTYFEDKKIKYCFQTNAIKKWIKEGKNDGSYNIEYEDCI